METCDETEAEKNNNWECNSICGHSNSVQTEILDDTDLCF